MQNHDAVVLWERIKLTSWLIFVLGFTFGISERTLSVWLSDSTLTSDDIIQLLTAGGFALIAFILKPAGVTK